MARYVPNTDPRQALLSDPTWLTRLERCAPRRPKLYHSGVRAQPRVQARVAAFCLSPHDVADAPLICPDYRMRVSIGAPWVGCSLQLPPAKHSCCVRPEMC